jgi:hypothetical protein
MSGFQRSDLSVLPDRQSLALATDSRAASYCPVFKHHAEASFAAHQRGDPPAPVITIGFPRIFDSPNPAHLRGWQRSLDRLLSFAHISCYFTIYEYSPPSRAAGALVSTTARDDSIPKCLLSVPAKRTFSFLPVSNSPEILSLLQSTFLASLTASVPLLKRTRRLQTCESQ